MQVTIIWFDDLKGFGEGRTSDNRVIFIPWQKLDMPGFKTAKVGQTVNVYSECQDESGER